MSSQNRAQGHRAVGVRRRVAVRRGIGARRGVGVLAAGLLGASAVLVTAGALPAQASTGKTVTLAVGQVRSVTYPAITGDDAQFLANRDIGNFLGADGIGATSGNGRPDPATCAQQTGCFVIPITLRVDPAVFKTQNFSLATNLSWNTIATAPTPIGNENGEELIGYLWQTPPKKDVHGNPIYDSTTYGNDPGAATAFNLTVVHYDLEVVQTAGPGEPFTIQFSFSDLSNQSYGAAPVNTGQSFGSAGFGQGSGPATTTTPTSPFAAPPAPTNVGTALPSGGVATGAPAPTIARGPAPIVVPNIAGGTLTPVLLAGTSYVPASGLGVGGPRNVTAKVLGANTPTKPASGIGLTVGLGLLPLIGLLFVLLLWARRRRASAIPLT